VKEDINIMGTKNRHAANERMMGMVEDCIGSPGPQWSVVLEAEQKKCLCLTKHPFMKMYGRLKPFLTSPLSATKWMASCII